jgi:hypothetical protein
MGLQIGSKRLIFLISGQLLTRIIYRRERRELKTHGFLAHPPYRVGSETGCLLFHNPLFSLRPLRLCG